MNNVKVWMALATVAMIVAASPVVAAAESQSQLEKNRPTGYEQVVNELRAWDLDAAGRTIFQLREKNPDQSAWFALEGAMAYLQGDYTKAIAQLTDALQKSPGDSEWLADLRCITQPAGCNRRQLHDDE